MSYIVTEQKRIPKSRLVVSVEKLERYAAAQGMELEDLPAETAPPAADPVSEVAKVGSNLNPGGGKSKSKLTLRLEMILSEHYPVFPQWRAIVNILKRVEHQDVVSRVDDQQECIVLKNGEPVYFVNLRERLTSARKSVKDQKNLRV